MPRRLPAWFLNSRARTLLAFARSATLPLSTLVNFQFLLPQGYLLRNLSADTPIPEEATEISSGLGSGAIFYDGIEADDIHQVVDNVVAGPGIPFIMQRTGGNVVGHHIFISDRFKCLQLSYSCFVPNLAVPTPP
jgi:hypothetical protein